MYTKVRTRVKTKLHVNQKKIAYCFLYNLHVSENLSHVENEVLSDSYTRLSSSTIVIVLKRPYIESLELYEG